MIECLLLETLLFPPRIKELSLMEWDLVVRQGRRSNILGRYYHLMHEHHLLEFIPDGPLRHLEWAHINSERLALSVRNEVGYISKALPGVAIVLLKGAAYTAGQLPAAMGRIFSDIDFLVPKDQLVDVENALMANGWVSMTADAYDQAYYRKWGHELPPLRHLRRNTIIDVHHAILPLSAVARPDPSKLIAASVAITADGALRILAPVDMFLHSATHLFYEGELQNGLRDLVDLSVLLQDFSREITFFDDLLDRAEQLGLQRPLFYALRYLRLMLKIDIPHRVVDKLNRSGPSRLLSAVMDAMYQRALLPDHASCIDRYAKLARFGIYLRGTWLRMPRLILAKHLFHKAFLSRSN